MHKSNKNNLLKSAGQLKNNLRKIRLPRSKSLYSASLVATLALGLTVAAAGQSSAGTQAAASAKPGATNTGVPAGTALKVHKGDLNITKAGTVIDGLDVKGSVYIRANNVTIKKSLIRGGKPSKTQQAIVVSWWGNTNIKIEDSTIRADHPSYWQDGISGGNITATRLNISKVVDSVKVIGGNVSLTNSWLHDNAHFSPDPNQSDNQTHDDGIQVTGGRNITITGNSIDGAHNAALMIGQGNTVGNVKISNNWLGGGGCTINVTQNGLGTPIHGMAISNNEFAPGNHGTACPMRLPSASPIGLSGNVWAANGRTAAPQRF